MCIRNKETKRTWNICFPNFTIHIVFRFVQFQTYELNIQDNTKNEYSSGEIKKYFLVEFVSFRSFYKKFDF